MLRKTFYISTLFAVGLGFSQCDKAPIYSNVPSIEFNSFSKDTVQQQTGVITFIVDFTDGDGDLGTDSTGVNNMIIIDNRRGDTLFYQIPPIPKQGVADAISGSVEVDIAQICCINPDLPIACSPIANTYQPVTYRIRIKDNAGNWSNEITTTALKIRCFE